MASKHTMKEEAHKEHESLRKEEEEHKHRRHGGATMKEHEERKAGGHAGRHMTHAGHRAASGGRELETIGPEPGHPGDRHVAEKRGGHGRRRRGGSTEEKAKPQIITGAGSHEIKEAEDEQDGFKKGGKAEHKKRKHGGHAEGALEHRRLDRRPRRAMGGHTPWSSGAEIERMAPDRSPKQYEKEG